MTLNEILNANGVAEDVATAILAAMKENKIFTASEENLDIRYGKLKTDHEGVTKQLNEANATIESLKKSTKGQEEAQQKITAYEQQVQQLNQQLADEKWRNRARLGLMQAGADDIDYVLYKLEESMTKEGKERKLTDADEIDGWEDLLKNMQTQLPQRFAKSDDNDDGYQVLNPNKLKGGDNGDLTVTKEKFASMGYEERMAIKQKNEKLYNSLVK
ncbi:MAG: phage scaffolding protein [Oscillospiraceae bacterium]|nr:phage scaffolding protein [Oscillospiraceae bacterium]